MNKGHVFQKKPQIHFTGSSALNDAHGDLCDDPVGPLVVGCGINECLFVLLGGDLCDLGHLWLLPSYFGSFSPDFSLISLLFSTGAAILVIVLV